MSRDQPEQQAPPVQRLRIRYAKRGRLRFTSHRDFSRAFERALARAQVPMAYSSGFNPHPRISYAGAAPTGSASEAEYLEIGLAEVLEPGHVLQSLVDSLPTGLDVVEVVDLATARQGALADLLEASRWLIDTDLPHAEAERAVTAFEALDSVTVERMTKKGLRSFDCRAAVLSLTVAAPVAPDSAGSPAAGARLEVVLRHGVPSVRPDDVLTGLRAAAGLPPTGQVLLTRLAQGPLDPQTLEVGDPLTE